VGSFDDPIDNMFHDIVETREGKTIRVLKNQASIDQSSKGFVIYDTSQGHRGLCGRLGCRVNYFR
jgi:hypothetical protein